MAIKNSFFETLKPPPESNLSAYFDSNTCVNISSLFLLHFVSQNHTFRAKSLTRLNICGILPEVKLQYLSILEETSMSALPAWLIAIISTTACLYLWLRDVRHTMQIQKSTVDSAASQFATCWENALHSQNDPAAAAVLARSESIYRQSVDNYNQSLKKPGNYLPALLMGFHHMDHLITRKRPPLYTSPPGHVPLSKTIADEKTGFISAEEEKMEKRGTNHV